MGLFKQITKTGIDIATTPVEIIKDVTTFGGALTEQDLPYTIKRLKEICEDIDDLPDSIDDGLL